MLAQGLSIAAAVFFAAFPVRAFLASPEAPLALKIAWCALAAAGVFPVWRARLLIAGAPLLPWLPFAHENVPGGIVHLLVLSQALPWLVQRALDRRAPALDAIGRWWGVLLLTALCGAASYYAALATTFDGLAPFADEMRTQLDRYVRLGPTIDVSALVVACTAFADALLAWLIVRSSPDSTRRLTELLAVTAASVAAIGVWQWFTGAGLRPDWRLTDPYITRINGTFSDPNALAAYLAALAPLAVGLAGAAAGRRRLAWLGATALMAAALVMTAGRVGLLGAVAGVALLALGALRVGLDREDSAALVRQYFRRAVVGGFSLIVVVVVGLIVTGTALDARHHRQQSPVDTWLYTFNLRRPLDETAKGRIGIWRAVGHLVADQPAFGIGPGLIFRIFPNYSQDVPEAPQGMSLSAHNTFLNITAELGLVGLAVWLALLAAILHAAWRSAGRRGDPDGDGGPWIGVALVGAWCACLVTMTTGDRTILREDLVLLGVLSALVSRRASPASLSRAGRGVLLATIAFLLVSTPFRMQSSSAQVRLDRVTAGLHPPEHARDGSSFRWTTGRAVFHVPASARVLTLSVRRIAPMPQTIRVFIRDAQVAEISPEDAAWRATRVILPRPRHGEYHRIEIHVSPTWRAPNDGRELGVMLTWDAR